MEEFVIESDGDLEIVVDNSRFLVSSAKMASLSPRFSAVFASFQTCDEEITFPTSAEVFRRIAQSAHGYFIPQADISLDVLLSLAHIIRDYEVPTDTALHALVNFSFVVQTVRPGRVSIGKLVTLLQVARALSHDKLATLLLDVFDGRPSAFNCCFSEVEANECTLLLVNILMRITKARDEVVRAILVDNMVYTIDSCFGFFQELRQVAGWILQEQPSLHEIQLRLEQFQICEEPSSDEAFVQETLQQCWKALRSARDDAKSFVQQCDVQDNVRDLAKQDFAVCEEEMGIADEYSMNSEIDGTEEESRLYGCCDVREDWTDVISDTASVHSCQTV